MNYSTYQRSKIEATNWTRDRHLIINTFAANPKIDLDPKLTKIVNFSNLFYV